ncbi:allene oxide cyclase barrel-like domain-containing protein [Streptomyces spiralis]
MPNTSKVKKLRSLTTAIGVALTLAGAVAVTQASATTTDHHVAQDIRDRSSNLERDHSKEFELVGKQTQYEEIDLGKKGVSLGDERVVTEDLYRDGKKVGDHGVVCTYVRVEPGLLQCLGTFSLPEGQLAGQALLHLPAPQSVDLAITGGTGAYSNARGYITTAPAGTTERHLSVHLER